MEVWGLFERFGSRVQEAGGSKPPGKGELDGLRLSPRDCFGNGDSSGRVLELNVRVGRGCPDRKHCNC